MKKIFFFLVLFALSFGVKAQSWTPIFGKQRFASGLGIPTKDSTYFAGAADSSLIYINPKDAGLYYKYKGYHKKVGTGTVSSVDLTMPSAFSVSGSPITNNGSFIVTGAGSITQYIRGDGSLATFAGAPGTLPVGGTAGQILSKIDGTNYNTQWIDNYSTQIKNDVKLGATLSKGTPVYVSSANGTNMIVSASSYDAEATSSKTFGLLESGGVLNDQVKVVTYGLLAGLNTSTATAGDPVWLGLNGALIYGYANKPIAPYHMVFIGIVTRVQSNNGEIFVNVQNGFELDELHNVAAQTPSNNDGLFYESSTSLWKNKSISTILGYTPEQPLTFSSPLSRSVNTVSIPAATGSVNGYLSSTDWTTFNSKEPAITAGTTAQYWRGDKSWQTLNTTAVAEGTNLYYTDARARAALIFVAGSGAYNSTTGVITIPTNTNQLTNGASFITLTSLSASAPLNYNNITGAFTISQANGTTNGYLSSTDWTTFNSKQAAITLTTTGSSGSSTLVGATLNVPTYTLAGLGGQPQLNGTGFVKASGTTISYDNSTYLTTSSAASTYVPYTGATANVNLGLNYSLTAALIIKSGGTSTQFLKADGSIDTNTYLTTGSAASTYLPLTGGTLTGDLTLSSTNPRLYFTDTDNNPDYFISNTDGTFTVYDVTNSLSRFTIGTTGNAYFRNAITGGGSITGESIYSNGIVSVGTSLSVGTTITATSSVSATRLILTGGTSPTGLYFGHTDKVVLANYTVGGGIDFETNGGNITMQLSSAGVLSTTGGASFSGALSGTSATFQNTSDTYSLTLAQSNASNAGWGQWADTGGNYKLSRLGGGVYSSPALTIALGGAATFSSSVTASGDIQSNGIYRDYQGEALIQTTTGAITQIGSGGATTSRTIAFLAGNSERMRITSAGNVGIGTTSPGYKLDIQSGQLRVLSGNSSNPALIIGEAGGAGTTNQGTLQFGDANSNFKIQGGNDYVGMLFTIGSERMRITSGGNVLIGTTTDNGFRLQVSGQMSSSAGIYSYGGVLNSIGTASNSIGSGPYLSIVNSSNSYQILQQLNASYNLDFWSYRGGWSNVSRIDGSTGIYMSLSDKTKKKDFEESNIGLAEVMQLKPMLFRMKSDDANSSKQLGFLAQDVKNIIPQAYVEQDNFIGLQDRPIIAALTKAIQELNQKITNLEAQIKQ